jgi:hypothetical protein
MFGSDMKVSFHSTGQCQWSRTDTWVKRQPNARNADRHVVLWSISQPTADQALLIFRVEIPMSEVRPQSPLIDKKKVFWISGAPAEATVRFLVYLTRIAATDPTSTRLHSPSIRHLFSLRLRGGRWVVVFVEVISLSARDIGEARQAVRDQVTAAGITPQPNHRAGLFITPTTEGGAHGLFEICLTEA